MMLEPVVFSYAKCLAEVREFQSFLGSRTTLKERDEISPFFKARDHLSAFLEVYNYRTVKFDRIGHEYPRFGDFECDLVVGDWSRRSYVFVEFEDAAPESIFVKKARNTPSWSPRFEHGFSQIVDWFYKFATQRHLPDFEERSVPGLYTPAACWSSEGSRTSDLANKTDSTGDKIISRSMGTGSTA